MEGQFLKAWCRGSRGAGESAINVASCSTDIGVDPDGGLICGGPGGAYPTPPIASPPPGNPPPAYPPGGGYSPPEGGRWSATLYDRTGFRGRAVQITGDTSNLDYSGLNDRGAFDPVRPSLGRLAVVLRTRTTAAAARPWAAASATRASSACAIPFPRCARSDNKLARAAGVRQPLSQAGQACRNSGARRDRRAVAHATRNGFRRLDKC